MLMFNFVNDKLHYYCYIYVVLLLFTFCSESYVSMCCSVYCFCVKVYCITATGSNQITVEKIYQIMSYNIDMMF